MRFCSRWILEGEVDDPFNEFFIAQQTTANASELWTQAYSIREHMRAFIPIDLSEKILAVGKTINFIRRYCGDKEFVCSIQHSRLDVSEASSESAVSSLKVCIDQL